MHRHLLMWPRAFVGASVIGLTLLTFFQFPGHTFLAADSQLYVPVLEQLRDPSLFRKELVTQLPQVTFTIYDEVTVGMHRLTGLDLRAVLTAQQLVYRALGILGVYLLATALGLSAEAALFVSAMFALGAPVLGPAVLTIEYEPVPRSFAVPLIFLALGLVAHRRVLSAAAAGTLAFLYHPTVTVPFWLVYLAQVFRPWQASVRRRWIMGLALMAGGIVMLFVCSRLQTGIQATPGLFERLRPEMETWLHTHIRYLWVGRWRAAVICNAVFLGVVSLAAFRRLLRFIPEEVRFYLAGMPLLGLASMVASYLLVDQMKLALMAQVEPARALLFVVSIASILTAVAAVKASQQQRYWESAAWLLVVFALPAQALVLEGGVRSLWAPLLWRLTLLIAGLALGAALALWVVQAKPRWATAAWGAAVLVPFFAFPLCAGERYAPAEYSPELKELAQWARTATPKDAVFLFPDVGQKAHPGVFRALALRAVYVDWNPGMLKFFPKHLAEEWWTRWQRTMAGGFRPERLQSYGELGIDYVVLQRRNLLSDRPTAFQNAQFVVYAVSRAAKGD